MAKASASMMGPARSARACKARAKKKPPESAPQTLATHMLYQNSNDHDGFVKELNVFMTGNNKKHIHV